MLQHALSPNVVLDASLDRPQGDIAVPPRHAACLTTRPSLCELQLVLALDNSLGASLSRPDGDIAVPPGAPRPEGARPGSAPTARNLPGWGGAPSDRAATMAARNIMLAAASTRVLQVSACMATAAPAQAQRAPRATQSDNGQ